ncbi:hypothetical protein GCM10028801_30980 [Nocardioides maradonensis]
MGRPDRNRDMSAYWEAYRANGDPEALEELFVQYRSLALYLAKKALAKAPSHQDHDDIISFAMHGLLDAIRRFDPEAGVKFETYATRRVTGAIIDEQRRMDPLPRTMRTKIKQLTQATSEFWERENRDPTVPELSEATGLPEEQVREALASQKTMVAELNPATADDDPGMLKAGHDEASASAELADLRSALAARLAACRGEAAAVLVLTYAEGREAKEVAHILCRTPHQVKSIQSKALGSLAG